MMTSTSRVFSTLGQALSKYHNPILLSLRRGQASVSYAQSLVEAPETLLTTLMGFTSEDTGLATCTVGESLRDREEQ